VVVGLNVLSLAMPGITATAPLPARMRLPAGSRAALALRPEKLVVTRERPAAFALAATITSVGYQGGQSVVHLAPEAGPPLRAHLPSGVAQGLARGQSVWASWAPDDAVVLTE
jgi:putative spermidine/putrescine transport system ATP-binding protein